MIDRLWINTTTMLRNENNDSWAELKVKDDSGNQYLDILIGEKGYYIYEADGKPPDIPINEYKPKKNVTLQVKKLVPVNKKKIEVKISFKNK